MYHGSLLYQAERQLSVREQREADRRIGEQAQALAELFRWFRRRHAEHAAATPEPPAHPLPATRRAAAADC